MAGAIERRKLRRREAWEHTCAVIDAIGNLGGSGRPIGSTFREMFDVEPPEMGYDEIVRTLQPLTLNPDGEHL